MYFDFKILRFHQVHVRYLFLYNYVQCEWLYLNSCNRFKLLIKTVIECLTLYLTTNNI